MEEVETGVVWQNCISKFVLSTSGGSSSVKKDATKKDKDSDKGDDAQKKTAIPDIEA